jgi:hypothetical protein
LKRIKAAMGTTFANYKKTIIKHLGSDLQMYEGRTDVKKGKILGHENLGQLTRRRTPMNIQTLRDPGIF